MDLVKDWNKIRMHFNKSFASNFHISIASVDADNKPTVTPIGTVFLNDNQTGFYFEKFSTKLPENAKTNPNICLLGVNSGSFFWLKALFLERFSSYPAIKLYGKLGERKKATDKEISRLNRRMKITKSLKGNKYLWGDMKYIRLITFSKVEMANIGKMTSDL